MAGNEQNPEIRYFIKALMECRSIKHTKSRLDNHFSYLEVQRQARNDAWNKGESVPWSHEPS